MTPALAAGAAGLVVMAFGAAHSRRPLLSLLLSAVCGAALLAALRVLQPYTGFALPLNRFTAYVCTVLGTPGVIALLFLAVLLG